MRTFVAEIAAYARKFNPNFVIVPQNGIELITKNGSINDPIEMNYMNTINGVGQEDLFYGGEDSNTKLSASSAKWVVAYLNKTRSYGKLVMVSDYCQTKSYRLDSYKKNAQLGFISESITNRYQSVVPPDPPFNENANNINKLTDAKNFLYFINPEGYTKSSLATLMKSLNYDILLMDPVIDLKSYTKAETDQLRTKRNGGKRMILCYMSIGEAEDYRYYWNNSWKSCTGFLDKVNPEWHGNIKVKYWMPEWKQIIYGNDNSMTKKLINANCDGAYLDIIDAFQYFENKNSNKC